MNPKIQDINKLELKQWYWNDRLSLREIAQRKKCSIQTILNYFNLFEIKRRTVSESLKKRDITWKDKISKANTGKIFSKKTRIKISKALKGKKAWNLNLTKTENPERVKYGCPKEQHWNWKGGISKIQILVRQSSEYKLWRKQCFIRDNYSCQKCGKHGGTLNVHHIVPFRILINEKRNLFELNNGVTLCKKCHKKIHQIQDI
jgi:predicted DNA-binding protein YlxM (UPF0122 family)